MIMAEVEITIGIKSIGQMWNISIVVKIFLLNSIQSLLSGVNVNNKLNNFFDNYLRSIKEVFALIKFTILFHYEILLVDNRVNIK